MKLIKNIHVYSPEDLGTKDVLISGEKIMKIDDSIEISGIDVDICDGTDKKLLPGLIDQHVHITGGGGEGGFATRVPESQLSHFIDAGITTTVGLLGTDSVTRSVENLVAKAYALREEGLSVYCLTGSYEYPAPTITGSTKKDIVFIDPIIGTKIAANDHRDSAIISEELARIGQEARVAGMIGNKSGHVVVHMGSGKFNMDQINHAIELSNIPMTILRPTHINRDRELALQALEYAQKGGYIDISAEIPAEISIPEILDLALEMDIDMSRLTISSDGFGSWSNYDENGNLIEMGYTPIDVIYKTMMTLINKGYDEELIISLVSTNVANSLKLDHKGQIKEGYDADLLIIDNDDNIDSVLMMGEYMKKNKKNLKKGNYE